MLFKNKNIEQYSRFCQKQIKKHINKRINLFLSAYLFKPEHIQNLHNKQIQLFIFNQYITWRFLAHGNTLSIEFLDTLLSSAATSLSANDLYIHVSIKNLLSLNKLNIDNILSKIKIEGDVHIASSLSKLIQSMHIDIEDVIGMYLPKKTAYIATQIIHKIFTHSQLSQQSFLNHTAYYLVDKNYIVSRIEFSTLEQPLRNLRDDVERLEQKIQQIKQYASHV
jgi:ubiquinone biosynthesis protein UbiJ